MRQLLRIARAVTAIVIPPIALLVSLALLASLIVAPPALIAETGIRHIIYENETIVPIQTKVRFTSLIVLPESEEILDWVCGDRDNWVISGEKNVTYIKPAQAGARTNLHLVTTAGHIYSFFVSEVGNTKTEPDLRVIIETSSTAFPTPTGMSRTRAAVQLEICRDDLARAQDAAKQADVKASEASNACRLTYPAQMRFPYAIERGKKPFFVEAMFHDGRFTYIRLAAPELPAIYETTEEGPQLVESEYRDGLFVIKKVLDRGYLALGKQQLPFSRAEGR
jgi:type IV secretion system protein VirB9